MTGMRLMIAVTVAALGLGACGGDTEVAVRTVTVTDTTAQETATPAPVGGDAILIETRITDGRRHIGEVVNGSLMGESSFCRGGRTTGGSDGPTITATFDCPGGTLTVHYAPTQRSVVQSSAWEVESATGRFEGLRGGGWMVAVFDDDDPDIGREVFTGTVGE